MIDIISNKLNLFVIFQQHYYLLILLFLSCSLFSLSRMDFTKQLCYGCRLVIKDMVRNFSSKFA